MKTLESSSLPGRVVMLCATLIACTFMSVQANPAQLAFQKSAALAPDVAFWVRVYSRLGNSQGMLHDARYLDIVYETVDDLPPEYSDERRALIETHIRACRERLLYLADANGRPRDPQDNWVLLTWNGRATASELRAAADNLRFQSGQTGRFRAGLQRSGAWRAHIEDMLRAAGLPLELAALPHVESSFDPLATSQSRRRRAVAAHSFDRQALSASRRPGR